MMTKVTFSNGGVFFNTLRKKVDDYFVTNNIKTTGNYKLYIKTIVLMTSAVACYTTLVFFTPSVWISLGICAIMGITLAGIGFNVMHDGGHGSYSSKKWLNSFMAYSLNLMGGSSYIWKIKHNVNHHSFTNIEGMDDDIDIKPWIRTNQNQPKHWYHRFQHIYFVILYGVTYLFWVFWQDFKKYFLSKVADTKLRTMELKEHFIFWGSKLLYIALFLVIPMYKVGVVDTLIGYLVIAFVCGLIISVVFQLAHVIKDTQFPEAIRGESTKIDEEWAVHQIKTTANFSTKSKVVSWFTGGLNYQVEHHLFPRVSHVHYPQISKFVKETCEQFNITYIEYPTLFSAVRSHVSYLRYVGVN